jgi:hypothetical protein
MPELHCATCGADQPVPRHCGQAMQQGDVDGVHMLVCWMGPGCGKQAIPEHCGTAMTITE